MDEFTTLSEEQLAAMEYTIDMLRDELRSQLIRELHSRQNEFMHLNIGTEGFSELMITLMPTLERLAEYLVSHMVLELLVDIAVKQNSRPN